MEFSKEELEKVLIGSLDRYDISKARVLMVREEGILFVCISANTTFKYLPNFVNWFYRTEEGKEYNNFYSLESKSFIWKEWIEENDFFQIFKTIDFIPLK